VATCRTIQGRLLIRPSPLLNEIILGVLGRAQRRYPLEIVGYVFTSSHYHLLLRVDQAERLSDFMGYFGGNLAREIVRLTGWKDKVWSRRYESILITDEESTQVERLTHSLTRRPRSPGRRCRRLMPGSWRPSARRRTSSGQETGMRRFQSGASRPGYRSWRLERVTYRGVNQRKLWRQL
jgi:Transposase IS200 like.